MPRRDKIILAIAGAVAVLLAYEEFAAPTPTSKLLGTCANPNALGVPTAAPATLSTLTASQAGGGLFGNPSGLGSNINAGQSAPSGPIADVPALLDTPVTSTLHVQPLSPYARPV